MTPATISIPLPHLKGKLEVSIGDEEGSCPGVYLAFLHDDKTKPEVPLVIVESEVDDPNHALTTYIYANQEHGEATSQFKYFPLEN